MLGDGAVAVHPSDERYAPIIGKLCEIPVGPKEHRRQIPIITDAYPDPDFGSGAVKITGAHDFNDNMVAKRGGIPMYRLMDTRGALRADGAPYAEEAAKAQGFARGDAFTEGEIDAINLIPDHLRGRSVRSIAGLVGRCHETRSKLRANHRFRGRRLKVECQSRVRPCWWRQLNALFLRLRPRCRIRQRTGAH